MTRKEATQGQKDLDLLVDYMWPDLDKEKKAYVRLCRLFHKYSKGDK